MGRPTLLTPELQASICKEIEAGLTYEDAASLSGIHDSTIRDWAARGKTGEEPFAAFSAAVIAARAKAKADAIKAVRAGVMMNHAADWKAEAWFLERTFPDQYGAQTAVHVKVEKELAAALDKLKESLPPDVYDQVLGALANGENVDNVAGVTVAGQDGGGEAGGTQGDGGTSV